MSQQLRIGTLCGLPATKRKLVTRHFPSSLLVPAPRNGAVEFKVRAQLMALWGGVILVSVTGDLDKLDALVEQFIQDEVGLVAVMGKNCELIHDVIDEILVGDVSRETPDILTSFHTGESLEEVMDFAEIFEKEYGGDIRVVEL